MKLFDVVSQFKLSTFVELQLTELILFKISERSSKSTLSVEFPQVDELILFLKRESFHFYFHKSNPAFAKYDFKTL